MKSCLKKITTHVIEIVETVNIDETVEITGDGNNLENPKDENAEEEEIVNPKNENAEEEEIVNAKD